jgi:hypothetical protein
MACASDSPASARCPFQEALADVLPAAAERGYYGQLLADYTRRRDLLADVLRGAWTRGR